MSRVCSLVFFVACHLLLGSWAQEEERFNPRCPPFECGVLGRIAFPFSNKTNPECGLSLTVDNCNETLQTIQFGKDGPRLFVPNISPDNTLTLQYDKTFESPRSSCKSLKNITFPISPFISVEEIKQIQFICPSNTTVPKDFDLNCNDTQRFITYRNNPKTDSRIPPPNCSFIEFRMNKTKESVEFLNLFAGWFRLQVSVTKECRDCDWRGGQCQFDKKGTFLCAKDSTGYGKSRLLVNLGLALGITAAGIGMLILLAFCFRKMLLSDISMIFLKKRSENYHNIEAILKIHGSLGPKRYDYSDIKKMTNSFKHKLGQGGFGGVYKGNLCDGRDVAVKVLKEAKGNGEDFINEVASISRTSHVNIVTLLGFCFEGRRRALIYEYACNGSLDRFIYEKTPLETILLKWETLYQISVGIARGLEYLHRGCSTRIFHFDIKPHNILLDKDFCPKISDFGLAKICPQKESVISMTGARGTIGYIAPEVFCRNFGAVSHKSDVYSYGMMVLEMVGRTNNINVDVDCTSELYFPHWIYNHLELDEELELKGIANEDDKERARKMIIVSLWCIQTNPSDRPTMSKVVDMLEGRLSSLQIPPQPFLSSSRSQLALSIYESKCDGAMSRFWSF